MRSRVVGWLLLVMLGGFAGILTVEWTHGQPTPPEKLPGDVLHPQDPFAKAIVPQPVRPAAVNSPANSQLDSPPAQQRKTPFDRFRNAHTLSEPMRAMVRSTQIGMEWLYRFNQVNGKFRPGYIPAVNQQMDGDHPLRQALATFVLARSARLTGDERYTTRANQAILTLLSDTMVEASQPGIRFPAQQSIVCNRLALAGLIVLAVSEVPEPAADLLTKSDELCAFIQRQQRADGSLRFTDDPADDSKTDDPQGVIQYPGPALLGMMLSQRHKPSRSKTELVRKAMTYYQKWFRDHPDPGMVPWMTSTCCEAFLATKDPVFCDFAFQMNDWLLTGQYEAAPDPKKRRWLGGFMGFADGKFVEAVPTIESARYLESLADCCRMIAHMPAPDTQRYDRYRNGALHAAQFQLSVQFNEFNTQHIAGDYQMLLIGGFHPTYSNGNLRVDQSASAVSAMIQLLLSGVDRQ